MLGFGFTKPEMILSFLPWSRYFAYPVQSNSPKEMEKLQKKFVSWMRGDSKLGVDGAPDARKKVLLLLGLDVAEALIEKAAQLPLRDCILLVFDNPDKLKVAKDVHIVDATFDSTKNIWVLSKYDPNFLDAAPVGWSRFDDVPTEQVPVAPVESKEVASGLVVSQSKPDKEKIESLIANLLRLVQQIKPKAVDAVHQLVVGRIWGVVDNDLWRSQVQKMTDWGITESVPLGIMKTLKEDGRLALLRSYAQDLLDGKKPIVDPSIQVEYDALISVFHPIE